MPLLDMEDGKGPSFKRLKRFESESTEDANNDMTDRYEYDANAFMNDFHARLIHRPLPSVQTMLSVVPQQGKQSDKLQVAQKSNHMMIPILDDFVQYWKKRSAPLNHLPPSQNDESNPNSTSSSPLEIQSTILTEGHHQRYKELLHIFGPLASQDAFSRLSYQNQISRKREWNTLKDMVIEERVQYALAWETFKQEHVHRFHIGFKIPSYYISHFAGMKAEYIEQYKQRWLSSKIQPPLYYGTTSVQNIYLEQNVRLDLHHLDTFAPKLLLRKRVGDEPVCSVSVNTLRQRWTGSKLSKIKIHTHLDSSCMLCEDESALLLAKEHDIDVVMTDKALDTILRLKEWNLSVLPIENTVVIEDPVPTPTGPKDCLSYGLTKGLMHEILLTHSNAGTSDDASTCGEYYYYSSMILQNRGHSTKVLIRSFVSLQDDHGNPILLDCRPNYFSELLGQEEPSGGDRAYWLIQKLLLPDSTLLTCNIDVVSSTLSSMSEKRIADALEINETLAAEKGLGTLGAFEEILVGTTLEQSLQTLTNVLSGAVIIEKDNEHSLVILSENMNGIALVHKAVKESPCHDMIDIRNIFRDSVNVFQNASWLVTHEYRPWKWSHQRIPFTFQAQHTVGAQSKKL